MLLALSTFPTRWSAPPPATRSSSSLSCVGLAAVPPESSSEMAETKSMRQDKRRTASKRLCRTAALGYASTVVQLAGVDTAVGLIAKIKQMARTASQNRTDCEHLARRVDVVANLLSRLRGDPVAAPTMAGLAATLREAHELVVSCHGHGRTHQFFNASRTAERFRNVERKIDSYLNHFQVINNIAIDG
ncbi:hypothetical protein HU200_034549 [Digitaria exilis]|uniref:Uncharacterized protein n=1 Tax=Digitaria exilis TaxID=1010633 RepID=A0A835ENS1_9POAL|nr:hypothetical protein HU200_034549 [Digitaria exilis]